jgi:hypothetical protein
VTTAKRICILAILLIVAAQGTAQAAQPVCCDQNGTSFPLCKVPLTKSYAILPGFCAQQIVGIVARSVPADCNECCGPYGVPPIYAAGNYVMVRQSTEGHERVAKFLTDLGVYVPPNPL